MSKIIVTNIQRLCVNDGPGVRSVVFLKGCSLQCPWCCNPEAIHLTKDNVFDRGKCSYPEKKIYCEECEKYGGERSKTDCPIHAYGTTSEEYSPDELLQILMRDESIYANGGGVTFSGGEPLLQIQVLLPVLQALKKRNVHIAFETALYVPKEYFTIAIPYVDYWLVDLKFQFGYFVNKEFYFPKNVLDENIVTLQNVVNQEKVRYRMVLMHEAMANAEAIVYSLKENKIMSVELLECHSLATNKYQQLGLVPRKFSTPTEDDVIKIGNLLNMSNIHYIYKRL